MKKSSIKKSSIKQSQYKKVQYKKGQHKNCIEKFVLKKIIKNVWSRCSPWGRSIQISRRSARSSTFSWTLCPLRPMWRHPVSTCRVSSRPWWRRSVGPLGAWVGQTCQFVWPPPRKVRFFAVWRNQINTYISDPALSYT